MVFSMTDEVYVFLYSALSGGLIMLFYDILSIAGEKKECPVFLLNVCDGIFIIVACAIMVFVNFTVSNGIGRDFGRDSLQVDPFPPDFCFFKENHGCYCRFF